VVGGEIGGDPIDRAEACRAAEFVEQDREGARHEAARDVARRRRRRGEVRPWRCAASCAWRFLTEPRRAIGPGIVAAAFLTALKPWYDAHPEISAKTALSPLELANVHELNQRGQACKKGLAISGADYELIKAWFAALPSRSPMPKLVFRDESWDESEHLAAMDGKAFLAWLASTEKTAKERFKTGHLTTAVYEDLDSDRSPNLLAAIHANDPKRLRIIRVDFDSGEHGTEDAPFTGGTLLKFVYDDHDQLVAIEGASYGFD